MPVLICRGCGRTVGMRKPKRRTKAQRRIADTIAANLAPGETVIAFVTCVDCTAKAMADAGESQVTAAQMEREARGGS